MANAIMMPSGKWKIQPTAKGKRICITADSKVEAEYMAAAWQHRQERVETGHDISLGDAIETYIESSEAILSPATIRGYHIAKKRIEKYGFDVYHVSVLGTKNLQRMVNMMAREYSPKTVRNTYALVTATFRFYAVPEVKGINMPRQPVRRYNVPTDADVRRLLDACAGTDFEVAVMLAAFGGLRRSEIVALTSDDLDGDVLHIHAAIVKGSDHEYHEKGTKTVSSDRYVKLPDFIVQRLDGIEGRLYPYPAEGITKRFETLRKRVGVNCTFHGLRHYAASKLHAVGIPDQYLLGRFGWSTDYALKTIYRNELDDVAKAMQDKANDAFCDVFFRSNATENATDL